MSTAAAREESRRSFALRTIQNDNALSLLLERIEALEAENKEQRELLAEVVGELSQDKTLSSRLMGFLKRKN